MQLQAATPDAYRLLHEGAIALSEVEANGIRIDVPRLERTIVELREEIKALEAGLKDDEVYRVWRRRFGSGTNLESRDQLAEVLFGVLGHPAQMFTAGGRPSAAQAHLETVDHPFAKKFVHIAKRRKAANTFLPGIQREVVNGRLHPFFNLNTVQTYRSSSDSPNFQNFPVRDEYISKLIRSLFVSTDEDHLLVENDFAGIEVRAGCPYHFDPVMIDYVYHSPPKDMHRDMAAQLFKMPISQVDKKPRYCTKNMFVFPEFYGDYYINCTKALWNAIGHHKLATKDGVGMLDHLASKGIKERGECNSKEKPVPGTFEHHVKKVEKDFWENRFRVYNEWKKKWYAQYLELGGFHTLTGFTIRGIYSRNDVVNYPVQGTAFHWLLWVLIRLVKWLKKYKMRSKVVGQIHDSIVGDVHYKEKDDYLEMVKYLVSKGLKKHWDWINVPLSVEAELCPRGGNWYEKKALEGF